MQLDIDLVRELLARVDRQPHDADSIDLSINGYNEETVADHVRLLDGLGYVTAVSLWTFQGNVWKSIRITWKGADFLTRARDDAAWNRARQMVEERVVGNSDFKLDVLKGLLDAAAEEL
jgi:hypothetical protein